MVESIRKDSEVLALKKGAESLAAVIPLLHLRV